MNTKLLELKDNFGYRLGGNHYNCTLLCLIKWHRTIRAYVHFNGVKRCFRQLEKTLINFRLNSFDLSPDLNSAYSRYKLTSSFWINCFYFISESANFCAKDTQTLDDCSQFSIFCKTFYLNIEMMIICLMASYSEDNYFLFSKRIVQCASLRCAKVVLAQHQNPVLSHYIAAYSSRFLAARWCLVAKLRDALLLPSNNF